MAINPVYLGLIGRRSFPQIGKQCSFVRHAGTKAPSKAIGSFMLALTSIHLNAQIANISSLNGLNRMHRASETQPFLAWFCLPY